MPTRAHIYTCSYANFVINIQMEIISSKFLHFVFLFLKNDKKDQF